MQDNIENLFSGIERDKRRDLVSLMNNNNGIIDKNITADEIAKSMVKDNNYGFAYMNLSKYTHDSGRHDPVLMQKFLVDSKLDKRNFLKEELELLDPDIIITAYLWNGAISQDDMDAYFGKIDFIKFGGSGNTGALHNYQLNNKTIKLLELYHFSNKCKLDIDYYEPVSNLLFGKML